MEYEDDWGVDDVYEHNTTSTRKRSAPKPIFSEDDVSLFLDALQYNVLFNMGFKVFTSSKNDEVNCVKTDMSTSDPIRRCWIETYDK